jgi:tetratricopeptide (TPR) repeat protein
MADRYAYVTLIGPFVMIAWGARDLLSRSRSGRVGLVVAGTVVLALCLAATARQLRFWRDGETLFARSLAVTQDNWLIHGMLGTQLALDGRLEESVAHTREALRIRPDYPQGHHNLANVLQLQGRHAEAAEHLEQALRRTPDYLKARYKLGISYLALGRPRDAAEQFEHAVRLNERYAEGHFQLGLAYARLRREADALREFDRAATLRPDWPQPLGALRTLAHSLAAAGRADEALRAGARALELARARGDRPLVETIERDLERYRERAGLAP